MSRMRGATAAGPTRADLRAIEREWPVIAAELAVVDAEIAAARTCDVDVSSELGRRRMRRAHAGLVRTIAAETRRGGHLDGAA